MAKLANQQFLFLRDVLVDSELLDPLDKGRCWFGIFPTSANFKDPTTTYLGQLYLYKYYTYFDISGYQEGKVSTLVVGTGFKNPVDTVLASHYDVNVNNFKNHTGDISQWTYEPNKWELYKNNTPFTPAQNSTKFENA